MADIVEWLKKGAQFVGETVVDIATIPVDIAVDSTTAVSNFMSNLGNLEIGDAFKDLAYDTGDIFENIGGNTLEVFDTDIFSGAPEVELGSIKLPDTATVPDMELPKIGESPVTSQPAVVTPTSSKKELSLSPGSTEFATQSPKPSNKFDLSNTYKGATPQQFDSINKFFGVEFEGVTYEDALRRIGTTESKPEIIAYSTAYKAHAKKNGIDVGSGFDDYVQENIKRLDKTLKPTFDVDSWGTNEWFTAASLLMSLGSFYLELENLDFQKDIIKGQEAREDESLDLQREQLQLQQDQQDFNNSVTLAQIEEDKRRWDLDFEQSERVFQARYGQTGGGGGGGGKGGIKLSSRNSFKS